ncbi:MAG: phosphatase PAP2 family protein [Candidatus Thorarchaeota archaeon]
MSKAKMNSTIGKRLVYLLGACFGFLALIFAVWDLEISMALVDSEAVWARFIAEYGEIPGNIIIVLAIFAVFIAVKETRTVKSSIIIAVVIGGLVWQISALINAIFGGINSQLILIVFPFVLVTLVVIRWGNFTISNEFQTFAVFTLILAVLNPLLFVQVIKIMWGRVRFRDLALDYSDYTPWFLPRGSTGHASFPSGHAAMGWMLLPILYVPRLKRKKAIYYLVTVIVLTWGVIVALGRVVAGAHYASDVLFSTGVAWLIFILLDKYYRGKTLYPNKSPQLARDAAKLQ